MAAESAADCVRRSALVVVMTPWPEFRSVPSAAFTRTPQLTVIDCWRLFAREEVGTVANLIYLGQGAAAAIHSSPDSWCMSETSKSDLIVVTGAGGFIGGHLIADLRHQVYTRLRAVDIKPLDHWYQRFDDVDNLSLDLSRTAACERACDGAALVYNLAADMGGMGFIELNKALCMLTVLKRGRNSDKTLIKQKLGWAPLSPPRGRHAADLRVDPRRDGWPRAKGVRLRSASQPNGDRTH